MGQAFGPRWRAAHRPRPPITHPTAAMSATRRDRVVMVLGLAALLLFAANLISFVQKQFHSRPHDIHVAEVAMPDVQAIVVAPRVHQHALELRIRDQALSGLTSRLGEEVARLSAESARLSADGHEEAADGLRDAISELRLKLERLQAESEETRRQLDMDRVHQELEAALETVDKADLKAIVISTDVAPSPADVSVEGTGNRR